MLLASSGLRAMRYWRSLLAAVLFASPAHADLLAGVEQLRHRDCTLSSRSLPPLRHTTALDAVAHQWSKGGRLAEALERSRYRITKSASMQVQGPTQDSKIAAVLRDNYCDILTDARFSEIGLFRREAHVWIVVAAPFSVPSSNDAAAIQRRVLDLVNAARSQDRRCGTTWFAAAGALRASTPLANAALEHARDMAQHDFFQHEGTDGSTPAVRATRAGYRWSSVAENIAAGITTAEQVVQDWLDSPGHCSNIMRPQFTEMGVAYATDPNSKPGIYWTHVLARPR